MENKSEVLLGPEGQLDRDTCFKEWFIFVYLVYVVIWYYLPLLPSHHAGKDYIKVMYSFRADDDNC